MIGQVGHDHNKLCRWVAAAFVNQSAWQVIHTSTPSFMEIKCKLPVKRKTHFTRTGLIQIPAQDRFLGFAMQKKRDRFMWHAFTLMSGENDKLLQRGDLCCVTASTKFWGQMQADWMALNAAFKSTAKKSQTSTLLYSNTGWKGKKPS